MLSLSLFLSGLPLPLFPVSDHALNNPVFESCCNIFAKLLFFERASSLRGSRSFRLPLPTAGRRTPVRTLQAGGSAVHVLCEGGGPIQASRHKWDTRASVGEGNPAVNTALLSSSSVGGARRSVGDINRSIP